MIQKKAKQREEESRATAAAETDAREQHENDFYAKLRMRREAKTVFKKPLTGHGND